MKSFVAVLSLMLLVSSVLGAIDGQVGSYKVSLTTEPAVIPVGKAKLTLRVSDAAGAPVNDLEIQGIARMPGMFMGEREQAMRPVADQPGTYSMQAAFPMKGKYEIGLKIRSATGTASGQLTASTGQDTGSAAAPGISLMTLLPWAVGLVLVVFVGHRMRKTSQRVDAKSIFNRATVGGTLLLGAMLAMAIYAVNNMRRDGAMTPLEAQVMEMNTPAPLGSTAVELGTVGYGAVVDTVSYAGQTVGFVEQDVVARTTGVIVSMPVYVGDKVRKGQVLARLDTTQLDPMLAEKAAMRAMATQDIGVASKEYQAALQEVAEVKAAVDVKQAGVAEADALLTAAVQERESAKAQISASEGELVDARAEVDTARQTASYLEDEMDRASQLFREDLISRSDYQRTQTDYASAKAKLDQANSRVKQADAKLAATKSNFDRAEAMIVASRKRKQQAESEVIAAKAAVLSKQRAADAAKQVVAREQAALSQARAGYEGASAQKGYATVVAESNGVVTQRLISPGTLVSPGQSMLKIVQITPIRIQANVASADLERVSEGDRAEFTVQKGGERKVGRISSISRSVDPLSRTGVVEVVWENKDQTILPGQFVEMFLRVGSSVGMLTIPKLALRQAAGSGRNFVWVADAAAGGVFTVRRVDVQVKSSAGNTVGVEGKLKKGEQVVVAGGLDLREGGEVWAPPQELHTKGPVVEVTEEGFVPNSVHIEKGKPVTITFVRRAEVTCGTEVIFPDFKIEKKLPLNEPVEVTITPDRTGEFKFACAMDMITGKVIVK